MVDGPEEPERPEAERGSSVYPGLPRHRRRPCGLKLVSQPLLVGDPATNCVFVCFSLMLLRRIKLLRRHLTDLIV